MNHKNIDGKNEFQRKRENWICVAILLCGLLFRMYYAHKVPYFISPHDLGELSDWKNIKNGHLGYIQYLYQYRKLFGAKPIGQFYHPPLFHCIGAVVIGICLNAGTKLTKAFEILQYCNTIFAFVGTLYVYRIFNKLHLKSRIKTILTLLVSFSPSFLILGTALNNDCLMTMFCIMAIYYTLRWMEDERILSIVKIALTIALAMLTKTSGGLIAPAIGTVFLYRLVKEKEKRKKLLLQYVIFGIICIPLGLSWILRNKLLYNVAFTYVPRLGLDSNQYVGNCTLFQRLGLPSVVQLFSNRIDWNDPVHFSNIWGQTILTMNYDEGILKIGTRYGRVLSVLFLWLSIVIYLSMLIRMIQVVWKKSVFVEIKLLFVGIYVVLMASYLSFCFKYPHICTMNFRYIVVTWYMLICSYGLYLREKKKDRFQIIQNVVTVCMVSYSILCVVLFTLFAV